MEQQLHLLTGAYALNAVTESERTDFELHALADPQTLEEVRSLSETAALLAFGTPSEEPPPALKANIMAAIRQTGQLPATAVVRDISSARSLARRDRGATRQRPRWVPAVAAAAALVLVAGVGIGGWALGHGFSQNNNDKQLAAEQTQQEAMLAIMGEPDAKIATTTVGGTTVVTIAASGKANQAAIMVKDMPSAPAGKSYELWFISGTGAVPAGLMKDPGASPSSVQVLEGPVDGATHIGITVEPAGGSPQPTTQPILVQAI